MASRHLLPAVALLLALSSAVFAQAVPRERLGLLISGHSLTDAPLDAYTRDIASSLRHEAAFVRHNAPGSPIVMRTIGHRDDPRRPDRFPWLGYARHASSDHRPLDLVRELRDPAAFGHGKPYTHLIVAERHDSLGPLEWEQTVPLLRHFYELAREGSPDVQGYFYATWFDLAGEGSSRDDPAGWVRFEREQLRLWESVVSRINDSLAREGRADRLATLPASGALAELVDRATTGHVPGVTAGSPRGTIDRLFADDVHLTDLGKYYIACVVYASVARHSPEGAAHPPSVPPEAAVSLQRLAWDYVRAYYDARPHGPQHAVDERLAIARDFVPLFWTYHRRPDQIRRGVQAFTARSLENPLWTSPTADESAFWYPRLP